MADVMGDGFSLDAVPKIMATATEPAGFKAVEYRVFVSGDLS
jgi:hypothetical protein